MKAATSLETAVPEPHFRGFPAGALGFLAGLAANNRRDWFAQHRAEFPAMLLAPARALVTELAPQLRRLSPGLRAEPRMGGSILRIHRDARFSRGSPFREHLQLWFWEGERPNRLCPGFFLSIAAREFTIGAGLRRVPTDLLPGYRRAVHQPSSGLELASLLARLERGGWSVRGGTLRRVPEPFPHEHERADLLRRTGLWAECRTPPPEELFGPDLPGLLVHRFRALQPLHSWLVRLP